MKNENLTHTKEVQSQMRNVSINNVEHIGFRLDKLISLCKYSISPKVFLSKLPSDLYIASYFKNGNIDSKTTIVFAEAVNSLLSNNRSLNEKQRVAVENIINIVNKEKSHAEYNFGLETNGYEHPEQQLLQPTMSDRTMMKLIVDKLGLYDKNSELSKARYKQLYQTFNKVISTMIPNYNVYAEWMDCKAVYPNITILQYIEHQTHFTSHLYAIAMNMK